MLERLGFIPSLGEADVQICIVDKAALKIIKRRETLHRGRKTSVKSLMFPHET